MGKGLMTKEDLKMFAYRMQVQYRTIGACLSSEDCTKAQDYLSKAFELLVSEAESQGVDVSNFR